MHIDVVITPRQAAALPNTIKPNSITLHRVWGARISMLGSIRHNTVLANFYPITLVNFTKTHNVPIFVVYSLKNSKKGKP